MAMPEIGSLEWESMVDFMRADLKNGMAYSRIIMKAKEKIESEGKNFHEEFEKWKLARKEERER